MNTYTKEEQKAHRRMWVDALRSGKYQQGSGQLRLVDKFCCLGVACDISTIGEWEGSTYVTYDGEDDTVLPASVVRFFGLGDTGGAMTSDSLWSLNDDGTPFARIADLIESEPEGLVE